MTTGTVIVTKALSDKGQHEVPMGSNTGPFVLECQHDTFLAGTGWPWCAAFVCKVAKDCGVPLAYDSAGAHDLADHHAALTTAEAKPGDVCDWNIGSGHTSILVKKDDAVGTWTTIDGNWADAVTQVDHPTSLLRRVWRIPGVDNAPPAPKPHRLPLWVVSTSSNGHRKILFRARTKKRLVRWLVRHTLSRIAPNGITITRAKRR